MELPEGARRLFPHDHFAGSGGCALVIGRLLEDGDGADLTWLFAAAGEARVSEWLAGRGGRQLSARSRAFFRLLLGSEPGPAAAGSAELWPL